MWSTGILPNYCKKCYCNARRIRLKETVLILKHRMPATRIIFRAMSTPCLTLENLNPNIKKMVYVNPSTLDLTSTQIQQELLKGVKKPFTEIIKATLGDPHSLGTIPITFIRQILALVLYPPLLHHPDFPEDTKRRARAILSARCGGSVGSYTEVNGVEAVRKDVASYIETRDGIYCDWENVMIGDGATDGIKKILRLFRCSSEGKHTGVMTPIPQIPLYRAAIAEFGMHQIGYHLDELQNWAVDIAELRRTIIEARTVSDPRVLIVINPGNPTGQVLTRETITEIIKFAHEEKLFLFVDEVYQDNVYDSGSQFFSFKKVLTEMGEPYSKMELASLMSCSKGYVGECGLRGGYTEVINMCPTVRDFYTAANSVTDTTALGEVCLDIMACPPRRDEPSYGLWCREKTHILNALKLGAEMVVEALNHIEGFRCNTIQGSMYAFPRITLPPKAILAAQKAGHQPDVFYAQELLVNTGICVVPGSTFGQKPGTYHFRMTILPEPHKLKLVIENLASFHADFLKKFP